MEIKQLFDRRSCTYTYLIYDNRRREAMIVDPVLDCVERDLSVLHEVGCKLKFTVDTHIHADHITGADLLRSKTGCKVYSPFFSKAVGSDKVLEDNEIVPLGMYSFEVMHTPGHTEDSICLYFQSEGFVITGDTLLIRKCGRTDFQNGDTADLFKSIKKLYHLPDNTIVYPGHDYDGRSCSTIYEEKLYNKRCDEQTSLNQFVEKMSSMRLEYPKFIDRAVPANKNCGKLESENSIFKNENGKVIAIDIDDTVLKTDGPPFYDNPKAIDGALEAIGKLLEEGYTVDFYTARHSNLWDLTHSQLKELGFSFRRLVTNKHPATIYIDDRAIKFTNWRDVEGEIL